MIDLPGRVDVANLKAVGLEDVFHQSNLFDSPSA
jgi:hypothetical protein